MARTPYLLARDDEVIYRIGLSSRKTIAPTNLSANEKWKQCNKREQTIVVNKAGNALQWFVKCDFLAPRPGQNKYVHKTNESDKRATWKCESVPVFFFEVPNAACCR